jgi:hypothetical protein
MTESQLQNATLDLIYLGKGRHKSAANGMGTMEAVAWLAGEKHSDRPDCTCPVITAYVSRIADWASDEQRQQLRAFLPRLIGSRSAEHMAPRAQYLTRQAVTMFLPIMYEDLKQPKIAASLRVLPADATPMQWRDVLYDARQIAFTDFKAEAAFVRGSVGAAVYAAVSAVTYTIARYVGAHDPIYAAYNTAVTAIYAAAASACVATNKKALRGDRNAAQRKFWAAALAALDGALTIGPAGPATLTPAMIERLKMYRALKQKAA